MQMSESEREEDEEALALTRLAAREAVTNGKTSLSRRLRPWVLLIVAVTCIVGFVQWPADESHPLSTAAATIGATSALAAAAVDDGASHSSAAFDSATSTPSCDCPAVEPAPVCETTTTPIPPSPAPPPPPPPRALVVYIFSNNDPHYVGNLEFFIKTAVRAHQEIDYIFVLSQGVTQPAGPEWNPKTDEWRHAYVARKYLPELPPNAIYVDHPNECYDLGTIGWFFGMADYAKAVRDNGGTPPAGIAPPKHWNAERYAHVKIDTRAYAYYFLLNSSVRGPILPTYFDLDSRDQYWYYPFLRVMQLDPEIKLVGPTANCLFSPHVQSYALFTDKIGMDLIRAGPTLKCTSDMYDAIYNGEVSTSWQILQAGWNLGSLLPDQQNVEWRGEGLTSHFCTSTHQRTNILADTTYNPYDIVFHKNQRRRPHLDTADQLVEWHDEVDQRRKERTAARGTLQKPISDADRAEWNRKKKGWHF